MRVLLILLGAAFMATLLFVGLGCEREVIIEEDNDQLSSTSCFTCHGEDGLLLAAEGEWRNSIHASGNNVDYTNRGGGYDCTRCHNHQGFLEFLATGAVSGPYDQVSSVHCFTCHAPHTRGNLSLRTDAPYALENDDIFDHGAGNLCVNCHHSRYSVDDITDSIDVYAYWGPHHGPQGDLLNGSNGYEFTGYSYGSTGHAFAFDNSGCVGCHMGNPQTHVGYRIGGHSFNMEDEESGETLVGVCQTEGCHGESAESFDYEGIQSRVDSLLVELEILLDDAGLIDTTAHPLEITIDDKNVAGALFNFLIVEEDRSHGVHNPEYIVDLLESSIAYMESVAKKAGTGKIAAMTIRPVRAH
jgi:hypothetical protein